MLGVFGLSVGDLGGFRGCGGSLGGRWVVMLDFRTYLAFVYAIGMVLGDLGGRWVIMLDRGA